MAKRPSKDRYYPLGFVQYGAEVREGFPVEAELLGVITILWNIQEKNLATTFARMLEAKSSDYARAIWDQQPTHKARRDLLSLALDHVSLDEPVRKLFERVLDETKRLADRRNELTHAEYVVHMKTEHLYARVSAPRSKKPPKLQRNTEKDLEQVVGDLERLIAATETLNVNLLPPAPGIIEFSRRALRRVQRKRARQSPGSPPDDYHPPSGPRKPRREP